jgi:hypothetical protein
MTSTKSRSRMVPGIVACCLLTSCGDARPQTTGEPGTAAQQGAEAPDEWGAISPAAGPDSLFEPAEQRRILPRHRIYYTLTDYDWYARGEPLVLDGVPYVPAGLPVAASADDMRQLGSYQGVDYYEWDDGAPQGGAVRLYVPVFEGYWQTFHADPARLAPDPARPGPDTARPGR